MGLRVPLTFAGLPLLLLPDLLNVGLDDGREGVQVVEAALFPQAVRLEGLALLGG